MKAFSVQKWYFPLIRFKMQIFKYLHTYVHMSIHTCVCMYNLAYEHKYEYTKASADSGVIIKIGQRLIAIYLCRHRIVVWI